MTTVSDVDAFERAVADARDRLSAREGGTVSWREIVRRAGFDDGSFGRVAYHLLPRERTRNGHHVPGWLIDALVPVLPISRADLMRAAAEAAGYDLTGTVDIAQTPDDVVVMVTRLLDDDRMAPAERDRVATEVLAAIVRARQRDEKDSGTPGA